MSASFLLLIGLLNLVILAGIARVFASMRRWAGFAPFCGYTLAVIVAAVIVLHRRDA